MKRTKKILAMLLCAVLLVTGTVAVTVAYLTSKTEVVQNTFTVGNVKITLDEALVTEYGVPAKGEWTDTDEDGVVDAYPDGEGDTNEAQTLKNIEMVEIVEDAIRVEKNTYKLIPNHTYVKDPTVHVAAGSEKSYIRMIVTISDLVDAKDVLGKDATTNYFLPQYFVEGWDGNVWKTTKTVTEKDTDNDGVMDTATYEFRYYKTINTLDGKVLDLEPLFTDIVVPEDIDNEDLAKLKELEINVIAHAIQADGFVDTVDGDGNVTVTAEEKAWVAFDDAQNDN